MNLLLQLLPQDLPTFIRQEILTELFEATAEAFGRPAPVLNHLSFDECLQTYAAFTKEQAEIALQSGQDVAALKTKLYQNAYPLGAKLRKWFGSDSLEEVMALGQILYRAIGVDIRGDTQGSVTVESCYFSQFYTPPVCDLISALDDGLFSGLSAGGRLVFSERITEGKQHCRARLLPRSD